MPRVNPARARRRPALLLDADVEAKIVQWYAGFLRLFGLFLRENGFSSIENLAAAAPPQLLLWAVRFLQQAYSQQWLGRTEAGGFISGLRRCLLQLVAAGVVQEMSTAGFDVPWRM